MNIHGNPVLVVVDFQGGPLDGDGDGYYPGGPALRDARDRASLLVNKCREKRVPVVWIQEVHKRHLIDIGRELDGSEGPHCIEGDPGTELAVGLNPTPGEFHIRKRRYSAFFGTELDLALRAHRCDSVILIGGFTDICVRYTAVDAHQRDFHITVATDVLSASSPQAHLDALDSIDYLQRDSLSTAAEILAWLDARPVA